MTPQQPTMSINKMLHSEGTGTNSDEETKGIGKGKYFFFARGPTLLRLFSFGRYSNSAYFFPFFFIFLTFVSIVKVFYSFKDSDITCLCSFELPIHPSIENERWIPISLKQCLLSVCSSWYAHHPNEHCTVVHSLTLDLLFV